MSSFMLMDRRMDRQTDRQTDRQRDNLNKSDSGVPQFCEQA